ncbi:MAG: Ribosome maturation factor RimP [Alphaproteobacteria bacterium MarineAlpha10_Bin2]|nr:MAG: Ribosome maturation factor RimP [Alphaproteobacteria bacterium MarineAlpha10_Bin2]
MEQTHRVEELIAPSLEALGFELVRVRFGGPGRPTLQIMIERQDREALTVDDCASASKAISALLDVEDPIGGAYNLEISSPGLDRPLTRIGDFERFAGFEAKIEVTLPVDGRKRLRGQVLGVENGNVRISRDEGSHSVPFETIKKAKLILTDELISSAQPQKRM